VTDRPNVLVCSGLDPSGGAGFLADARVVEAVGARPVGVITALTVQSTSGVTGMKPVDAELLRDQLELLLGDVEVRAVKLGMLGSSDVARAIGAALQLSSAPLVWDPVLMPSQGGVPLFQGDLGASFLALQPHLALLTPNARELALLARREVTDLPSAIAAAQALAGELDAAVLVKGGHLGGDASVDVVVRRDRTDALPGPRIPGGEHVHGTGCALSSAIAAYLATGLELVEACRAAKAFVAARISAPVSAGRGAPSIM